MKKLLIFAMLFFPALAFGQGWRFENNVLEQGTISQVTNAALIPTQPVIHVCAWPANSVPCTNLATTYTNITLATSCPQSTQITLAGSSSCVGNTDTQGNWGVWVSPGATYSFTVTIVGVGNFGPYGFTASSGGGGGTSWPSLAGIAQCTGSPCSAWAGSVASTAPGDLILGTGSLWTKFAGNNSGTQCFSENSSGVGAWTDCGGGSSGGSIGVNVSPVNCAGLQTAINTAATMSGIEGSVVNYPSADITCNSQLVIPPGSQVIINGAGTSSRLINALGTDALVMAKGSLGASSTTTNAYAAGAFSINVASGGTFTAPQWVEIASVAGDPSYYPCPNTAPAGSGGQCNSELKVINSVVGNTLKFDDSLENSYASGATVTIVTPVVLQMKNMAIVNTGMSFPAIKLWYCVYCKVENVEIAGGLWVNAATPAIQVGLYHTKYSTVANNLLGQFDGLLQGGTQSAAIVIAGASSHNTVSGNHIFKIVENAIVESSHHNIVTENDIEGCIDDCFNTHGDGNFANIFSNNVISGIGPNVTVNGLGLYISAGPPGRPGFPDRDNVITGNTISNFGNEGIGVFSNGSPGAGVANNIISNNVVRNGLTPSGDGIAVEYCLGCSVTGNTVTDMATNGIAYVIEQNNTLTFTGNQGNQTNSATGTYGFFGATNNDATITGNIMRNFAAYDWYFVNTNQATLFANNIGFAGGSGNYSYDATTNSSFLRWNNLGDTFYANSYGDSPMHSTFFGTANTAFGSAATISVNNFQKSIKVLNMSITANGAAPSCSLYPTYIVTDGAITTTSLSLNTNYVTTNFSPVVFPANDPISIRQNGAATCTTYPTFIDVNVEYAETGQ